jgi:hypothetical protein
MVGCAEKSIVTEASQLRAIAAAFNNSSVSRREKRFERGASDARRLVSDGRRTL